MVWSKDGMPTRKQLCVLAVGFVLGFILGIVLLSPGKYSQKSSPDNTASVLREGAGPIKLSQGYRTWLSKQGVTRKPLDLDEYFYGNLKGEVTLEAEWLKGKAHVTCVVFVESEKNVIAAMQTWLKHCNEYSLYHVRKQQQHTFTDLHFEHASNVKTIKAESSWDFLCKVILDLWKLKGNKLQWLLFVSDDMFVVPENLRKMVAHVDWNRPFYLGHAQSLWKQPYNVAIAGYVLSKGSVQLLAQNFTLPEHCSSGGKYWKKEDYYLGKNLEKMFVLPSDTRDESGKGRFHGYNLNQLLFSNKLALIASYWKNSLYPSTEGKNCCSDWSITFQGIEADKMHMYDYIINHLQVFTHGRHGSQPAPTPYPPDEVWQDFLRSQGYSSVRNVSSKQYIKAWKKKIREDLVKSGFLKKDYTWQKMAGKNGDGHGEVIPLPFQLETSQETD